MSTVRSDTVRSWQASREGPVTCLSQDCNVIVIELSRGRDEDVVRCIRMVMGEVRRSLRKMAARLKVFECESHRQAFDLARLMNRQVIVRIGEKIYRVTPTGVESDMTETYRKFFGEVEGNAGKKAAANVAKEQQTSIPQRQ